MSIERCESCSALIDTDFDDGCYVEVGLTEDELATIVLCEVCRDDEEEETHAVPEL